MPDNIEDLAYFNESDLWKMMKYYNCSSLPTPRFILNYDPYDYSYLPEELHELKRFCDIAQKYWITKWREKSVNKALEGAERFKQQTPVIE